MRFLGRFRVACLRRGGSPKARPCLRAETKRNESLRPHTAPRTRSRPRPPTPPHTPRRKAQSLSRHARETLRPGQLRAVLRGSSSYFPLLAVPLSGVQALPLRGRPRDKACTTACAFRPTNGQVRRALCDTTVSGYKTRPRADHHRRPQTLPTLPKTGRLNKCAA